MLRPGLILIVAMQTCLLASASLADDGVIDTGAVRLIPMASGVYAVEPVFAGANGAIILNDNGHIVVDSHGSPASAHALVEAVATISDKPIRYVINTHWHVDHHAGNEAYRAAFGSDAILISHEHTRADIPTLGREQFDQVAPYRSMPVQRANEQLESGRNNHGAPLTDQQRRNVESFLERQLEFVEREPFEFALPNLTYARSLTLHGTPHKVEVFFLHPAHTRSDSIVYLREQQILIIGDLLTQPILWSWSSYPADYAKVLRELEALPATQIVIGHGGPVLHDKQYLVLVREFLETIVGFVRQNIARDKDETAAIEAAANDPGIQLFRDRFVTQAENEMFDQMVGWTVSRAYAEAVN